MKGLFAVLMLALGAGAHSPLSIRASHSSLTRVVEIRAINDNGLWEAKAQTPASVLALIGNIRASLGSRFACLDLVGGKQASITEPIEKTSRTLDQYLVAAQNAGCDIVPELNLDYYTNRGGRYPPPQGMTSPQFFYYLARMYASLSAIKHGPHEILLSSWAGEFYSRVGPETARDVLTKLSAMGWIPIPGDDVCWDSDFGFAKYTSTNETVLMTQVPFVFPNAAEIRQAIAEEPYLSGHLVRIEGQIQHQIKYNSQINSFAHLNPDEQAAALTGMAQGQASGYYTQVWPIIVNAGPSPRVTWDATIAKQSNGETFLPYIVSLMKQYN